MNVVDPLGLQPSPYGSQIPGISDQQYAQFWLESQRYPGLSVATIAGAYLGSPTDQAQIQSYCGQLQVSAKFWNQVEATVRALETTQARITAIG
ncbi:MAG TPA: hypothetical protein VE990_06220, partial [Acidimicrobiales bacterium]|nr:hypothetical protein [Acidimicrobiales bacterium]